jgi:hypothetical protein
VEHPQVRLKKIAAKSVNLKSPSHQHPTSNGTDPASSTESFKSAVTGEIDGEQRNTNVNNDEVDVQAEDALPPARLVASLSSVKSVTSGKKGNAKKNPPKKKSNQAKPLKGGFWEVETILDVRKSGKSYEYLVQWKGDYENTWEPKKYLNKLALQDAHELMRTKNQQLSEPAVVTSSTTTQEETGGFNESGDQTM